MQTITCSITSPVNEDLLKEQLNTALPGIFLGLNNAASGQIGVVLTDAATQQNITTAQTTCTSHDGTLPSMAQAALDDVKARWVASALHGKTPAQIYTTLQNAIDGWASLANAKSDLRVWLPLLAAALAWTVFRDQQQG